METRSAASASPGASMSAPQASAVAWGAIFAGAFAAMAASVILIALGVGLGFSAASPWSGQGMNAKAIGVGAVIWLVVAQWLSAAFGGYLTGRLRLRWNYLDNDEVFFRDTAHGLLAWAVSLVLIAVTATAMSVGVLGGLASGAATGAAQGATQSAATNDRMGYFTDSLFRSNAPSASAAAAETQGEATRILSRGVGGDVSADDRAYLARLVAARTGLSEPEAQRRVDQTIAQIKEAADAARKAAATAAIATALSLAIGAFIAAVAAGLGGRERDA